MKHDTLHRISEIFAILDQYPVEIVQGEDSNLMIQLKRDTQVSPEHKEQLNDLEAFNQTISYCWEVFL